MIKTFRDKDTESIFARRFLKRFATDLHKIAWQKLAVLDAAERLDDLLVPPGNRLEKLSGDRAGQYSIRINEQWRICFQWREGNANDVEITDYHLEITMSENFVPIHPGEILLVEFLKPMGLSQYQLAKDINVPPRRINEIVHGDRSITADTALRLSRYFGMSENFWMNLQARYDLEIQKDRLAGRLDREVRVCAVSRAG